MRRNILLNISTDFFTSGEHKNYSEKVLKEIVQEELNKHFAVYNGEVTELMVINSSEVNEYLDSHGADNLISFER